ncbi:type II toxin-antitoxin system CcdA family antitoxin [Actibacterium sp. D379-3]
MQNAQPRKSTNLSLDSGLLSEARALKVNLSRAAEDGIRAAVLRSRSERWKADNRAALDSSNTFVEQRGLPLSGLRQF